MENDDSVSYASDDSPLLEAALSSEIADMIRLPSIVAREKCASKNKKATTGRPSPYLKLEKAVFPHNFNLSQYQSSSITNGHPLGDYPASLSASSPLSNFSNYAGQFPRPQPSGRIPSGGGSEDADPSPYKSASLIHQNLPSTPSSTQAFGTRPSLNSQPLASPLRGLPYTDFRTKRFSDTSLVRYADDNDLEPIVPTPTPAFLQGILDLLSSDDWRQQFDGLTDLRRLAKHHTSLCSMVGIGGCNVRGSRRISTSQPFIHQICGPLVELIDSLRSNVAKNAMLGLHSLFFYAASAMSDAVVLERTLTICLRKAGAPGAGASLIVEAEKALRQICLSVVSEARLLNCLLRNLKDSRQSQKLKSVVGQALCLLLIRLDSNVGHVIPPKELNLLIVSLVKLASEASPETRKYGKLGVCVLSRSLSDFSTTRMRQFLSESKLKEFNVSARLASKTLDECLLLGLSFEDLSLDLSTMFSAFNSHTSSQPDTLEHFVPARSPTPNIAGTRSSPQRLKRRSCSTSIALTSPQTPLSILAIPRPCSPRPSGGHSNDLNTIKEQGVEMQSQGGHVNVVSAAWNKKGENRDRTWTPTRERRALPQDVLSPIMGQTSSTPNRGQTFSTPNRGQRCSTPNRGQRCSTPIQGQRCSTPIQGQRYSTPIQGQRCSTPIQEQRCSTPIQDQRFSTPIRSQRCSTPIRGQTYTSPIRGQTCSALIRGQIMQFPLTLVFTLVGPHTWRKQSAVPLRPENVLENGKSESGSLHHQPSSPSKRSEIQMQRIDHQNRYGTNCLGRSAIEIGGAVVNASNRKASNQTMDGSLQLDLASMPPRTTTPPAARRLRADSGPSPHHTSRPSFSARLDHR